MDLGALITPKCGERPLNTSCRGHTQGSPFDYPAKKPKKDKPIKTTQLIQGLTGIGALARRSQYTSADYPYSLQKPSHYYRSSYK